MLWRAVERLAEDAADELESLMFERAAWLGSTPLAFIRMLAVSADVKDEPDNGRRSYRVVRRPSGWFGIPACRRRGVVWWRCRYVPRTLWGWCRPSWGLANTGLPDDALVMTHMSVLATVSKPMWTIPAVGTERLLSRSWRRNSFVAVSGAFGAEGLHVGGEAENGAVVGYSDEQLAALGVEEAADGLRDGVLHLLVGPGGSHVPAGGGT